MPVKTSKIKSATVIGNGSTSRTAFVVLKELNVKKIFLTSRNKKKYNSWNINNSVKIIDWNEREDIISDVLINCTSMGMKNMNILPLKINSNKQFKFIIDLPINKNAALSKIAKKFNISYIDGQQISLLQGIEQFRIYNGKKLFFNKMKKILNYKF